MRQSGIYMKIVLLAALFACTNALATDLGNIGKTYPIIEQDLIEKIKGKISEKEKSGELNQLNQEWLSRSKDYATAPKGLLLPAAVVPKITLLETRITLKSDLKGIEGNVLYPRGTTVNPLKIMRLTYAMCFIDGEDEKQVNWMIEHCTKNPLNKLVLVNGPLEVLSKHTGLRLFFDQGGDLIRRLKITALPAVLSQKGGDLYVEEIPLL
jgi:conjugal transfer pilus assembly protein TraW